MVFSYFGTFTLTLRQERFLIFGLEVNQDTDIQNKQHEQQQPNCKDNEIRVIIPVGFIRESIHTKR